MEMITIEKQPRFKVGEIYYDTLQEAQIAELNAIDLNGTDSFAHTVLNNAPAILAILQFKAKGKRGAWTPEQRAKAAATRAAKQAAKAQGQTTPPPADAPKAKGKKFSPMA
jgi:hypothetical protein